MRFAAKQYFLLLSIRIVLLTFTLSNQILSPQIHHQCNVFDIIDHIKFANNHKCLQITVNFDSQLLNCTFSQSVNDIRFQIRSLESMKSRNIMVEQYGQCETFLIFTENWEMAKQLIVNYKQNETTTEPRPKQFFPFSYIYFHLSDSNIPPANEDDSIRRYLYENAIFGFFLEYVGNEFRLQDLLEYVVEGNAEWKIPKNLLHPLVNTAMLKEANFRISLFNWPPYNFYPESETNETKIDEIDGIEFRLVNEVTKNWNKKLLLTERMPSRSQFTEVIEDLLKNKSDMALCAVWYRNSFDIVDLSSYFEPQCCNLFVPKPKKLNDLSTMSTIFTFDVWTLFFCTFLASTILLTIIAKIEEHFFKDKSIYANFGRTVLEATNTATLHSVERFPKHLSLQILLFSWILLSFWIGICYATIYTSRLTKPSYTKPINSVKEFLNQGIHLCGPDNSSVTYSTYLQSSSSDYRTLAQQIIIYSGDKEQRYKLFRERKCGLLAITTKNKFVLSLSLENEPEFLANFRLMKFCTLSRFTAFAFQKYSPYTKLFNWHIRRFQENGLITKWLLDITPIQKWTKPLFEDYPDDFNDPKKIELNHLSGVFFLLLSGLLIAAISFVIELTVVF